MQEAITRDPEVMHGVPVFRGTRVPAKTLFEYLENGDSLDDFLEGFPTLSRELAVQSSRSAKSSASVLVTTDQAIPQQQNLAKRQISILILCGPSNRLAELRNLSSGSAGYVLRPPVVSEGDFS